MTKSLTEQARAMGRARQAMLTPEERTRNARDLAQRRWKGRGLTRDQARVLGKLRRSGSASIPTPPGDGGDRVLRALRELDSRRWIAQVRYAPTEARYVSGPLWDQAVQALEKHRVKKST